MSPAVLRPTGLILALALGLASSLPAAAQSGYSWVYDRTVAARPDQTALSVTYGVPQTDDYQLLARCLWSGGSPQVEVTLTLPDSGPAPGTQTTLNVVSNRGYQDRLNVAVFGGEAYGVRFFVGPGHPFLAALRDHGELSYGLFAGSGGTLSLRGSGQAMTGFITDCARMATLRPGGSSGQGQARASDHGCTQVGRVRSPGSNARVPATFVNRSGGFRAIYWLDFNGQPVEYATLAAGQSYSVDSFDGHVWMITDGPGNCVQVVAMRRGQGTYALDVQRSFGSE